MSRNSSNITPAVLVVDDVPQNLIAMEALLSDLDIELHKANSGEEALKICTRIDFSLILLDVQMPGMDGYETAEALRSIEKTKYIPIIFVTAISTDQTNMIKGYESGAVDYLFKPVVSTVLVSKVKVFIELDQQKRELRKLNRQMEEFVGLVTHDLRSPIASISSCIELLKMESIESESVLEKVNWIRDSSDRAHAIVSDLLDLAAMETGNIRITSSPFDLTKLVKSIVIECQSQASKKSITIENKIDSHINVIADKNRIAQVLNNLISNAVKFTKPSGKVTLTAENSRKGTLINVYDTGVGIKETDISKLFDKHIWFSQSGTEGESGTGYGLPLSQQILTAHNSEIKVTSEPDKGSCFSFMLPKR